MNRIDSFSGPHRFLSNFFPCSVDYDGLMYPSVENAYQAAKTLDLHKRREFVRMTASEAKRTGRRLKLRPDWEQVKIGIMLELLRLKFTPLHTYGPTLLDSLLATGDAELIEGNHWGDRFWGVCNGVGENHLGKPLMQVRKRNERNCHEYRRIRG